MKEAYSDQEKFISNLLIFVFIFIIILITVLALHYAGVFNLQNDIPDSTTEALTTSNTDSLQSTSESTKYLPATIPPFTTSASVSTQQSSKETEATPPSFDQSEIITPDDISDEKMAELIEEKYLSVHENSRPGYKLESIKNIVVHYVANPNTTALQNWKYFENSKPGTSAHFIIDLDGSILQCMPLDEVAWAIGTPEGNYTSISIECCHPDSTGKFTEATYESLVKLVSWLCAKFDLTEQEVKRHYDYPRTTDSGFVWHKQCPLYYVNHPEEWEAFKEDLYIAR